MTFKLNRPIQQVHLYDEDGNEVPVKDGVVLKENASGFLVYALNQDGKTHVIHTSQDFLNPTINRLATEGPVELFDHLGHPVAVILDGATYRLAADANLSKWIGSSAPTVGQKAMASSIPVTMATDQPPQKTQLYDENGNLITVTKDEDKYRLEVQGKVSIAPSTPPATATVVQLVADDPLSISGTIDIDYTITNGKRFVLQQILAGASGDPTERGSVVELFFRNGSTYKIIERIYLSGFSTNLVFPDIDFARDGTKMDGNGTTKITIRRRAFSGGKREIDAVIFGYEVTTL